MREYWQFDQVLFFLQVKKLQRACLRNPVKVWWQYLHPYLFFPLVFLIGLVICVIFQFFQIEAASKYSTVDTLKQQYRFVPSKHKVCPVSIVWHYFIWYCKRKTKFISKYILLMFDTDTMEIQRICMLIMEFVLANIFIQGRILSVCMRL